MKPTLVALLLAAETRIAELRMLVETEKELPQMMLARALVSIDALAVEVGRQVATIKGEARPRRML